jgi:serine-type D-Ala-D-Ala carboxypeptidase/endopeptidase
MTSTMVALTDGARARLAQGYNADGRAMSPTELPAFEAAGALRSTAGDLVTLLQAELAASRDPKSRLARAMALTQQPERDLDAGKPGKIGLAWLIKPDGTIWHSGQTGGYHGYVAFDPSRQLGVVVLANGMTNQIDALGEAALAALAGAPVPAKLDLPPPDVKVTEKTLDTYVGTYTIGPGFVIAIERRGASLYAQATGQPRLRLHATSQNDFSIRATAVTGTFERDARGKVTGLVVHQHGLALHATRN